MDLIVVNVNPNDDSGQPAHLRVSGKRVRDLSQRVEMIVRFVTSYDIKSADFSQKKKCLLQALEKSSEKREKEVIIVNEFILPRLASYSKSIIFDILKTNITILNINLHNNLIDDEEACLLSEALMHNKALQKLNLKGNIIGLRGAKALSEALSYNRFLLHLDLYGNVIPILGVQALGKAIRSNKFLKHIDLRNKQISIHRVKSIVKASKLNSSLVEFLYL